MGTHRATVTRDGKWWRVKVSGLLGGTQVRRLSEAKVAARRLIAEAGIGESDVVVMTYDVSERMADAALVRQHREDARRASEIASRLARDVAATMAAEGVPLRDIGFLLGVSTTRVSELLSVKAPRVLDTAAVRGGVL